MNNLSSEHANQPQGQDQPQMQQASGLPLEGTNPALLCFLREQHRLQMDQVLQLYNEQVRVLLHKEMAIQNLTQLSQRATDALLEKVEEVASLKEEVACMHVEMQRKQARLELACQIFATAIETNESLIPGPPLVQQEMNSHASSNHLDAPGSADEASSGVRPAAETTKIDLICKVCNSGRACMLLLPCQHLCVCTSCAVRGLTACPVCGAVNGGAVEARFVEK